MRHSAQAAPGYVVVARVDQFAHGAAVVHATTGGAIALFREGSRIFAVDDACLRCGTSLAGGKRDGAHVACTVCKWRYDLTTGALERLPSLRLETFEVKIVGDDVLVALPPWGRSAGR